LTRLATEFIFETNYRTKNEL